MTQRTPPAPSSPDWQEELAQTIAQERGFLYRLARAQLRDAQSADDVVQETMLVAWESGDRFERRSSLRTWLVGILRFKILDALRQQHKQALRCSSLDAQQALQLIDEDVLFDAQGGWQDPPATAQERDMDPFLALQQKQSLGMLELCLQQLPEQARQVFLMREYLGCDGPEIAQTTGLRADHVRVILMRARLTLRACMVWQMSVKHEGI